MADNFTVLEVNLFPSSFSFTAILLIFCKFIYSAFSPHFFRFFWSPNSRI
jgi:hypothetical protein